MPPSPTTHKTADIRANLTRPIVLVGLMGVGKSTVGKRLATRLGLPFVDSDEEIADAAGMSPGELFDNYGERQFRDGERRVIARLIDGTVKVIATGGGAFVNDETRALLLSRAMPVWLDADIDVLAERVARRDTRPLVRGDDPRAALAELAEQRNPLYAQAPIKVQSDAGSHEATVDRIIQALGACIA
ncbi:MAG: shikimate kinase [Parasphingopyxis sp.]|nr:shikimate kinase [Sphingomonadales bacterium]